MGITHNTMFAADEARALQVSPPRTLAQLKALGSGQRGAGMVVEVYDTLGDLSRWVFHATSELTADDILVVAPAASSGRWLRAPGFALLKIPFTFATLDNAAILTTPAGCKFQILEPMWKIAVSLTGGSSSAIGLSSTKTGFTAKGALLGGAGGDVAATLVAAATATLGTVGSGNDTLAKRRVIWEPTETVDFDRITSAFTAGSGEAWLSVNILQNAGA